MPSPKECRANADVCRSLARESTLAYAREALFELAAELDKIADEMERKALVRQQHR
jgi:uncharacterized protein Yka (UPF0111/DUF47 family)